MNRTRYAIVVWCLSVLCAATVGAVTEDEYQAEIRRLEQRTAQLEHSLEEVTAALQQADVTVTMLKKQIMDMTGDAEAYAREATEARAAMKQVKDQLTALLAQQSAVDSKALEQQLAAAVQRAQKLAEDLKLAKAEIAEQDKTLARLQRRQEAGDAPQLRQDSDALRVELQQQREQFKATVGMLQDREAEVNTARATIQRLQEQLRSASTDARVEELEAALAEVNAKLIAVANEKNSLETQVRGTDQSQQQIQRKDAEIARLEGELRKAADYINARAANITALEDDKSGLQTRQLGLEKTVIELEMRAREAQAANAELETRLTMLTAQNTDLEGHLAAVRNAKTELESRLGQIAESKTGLESRLTKSLEERAARIRELESERQSLQTQLESAEARAREADQIALERSAAIGKLEADLRYQSSVPDAAKERIAELTLELQDVKSQFDLQETMKREYPKLRQDVSACQSTLAELTQERDRCQTAGKELREQVLSLEQTRDRLDLTLREKLGELDAASTRNLELKGDVTTEAAQRKTETQTYRDTLVRNRELEEQHAEGLRQLRLKEQVLQHTLTDKALLEKQLETSDGSFSVLQAQLAALREEALTLRQSHALGLETRQGDTTAQAVLQAQIQQEQARRRQLEAELLAAQKTVQTLRSQQPGQPAAAIQPIPAVAASAPAGAGTTLERLFPQEILRSLSGSPVTVLSISPNNARMAYQESEGQTERLWMLDTRTRQVTRLLEWQRGAHAATVTSTFAWAFDDEHFLFSTGAPGGYGLYLGNSGGMLGQPVMIRDAAPHFAWAPQHLRFAYLDGANLVAQEVRGGALPLRVGNTSGGSDGTSLQWSPDGSMLAFSIKRDNNFDIFTVALGGSQPTIQAVVASPSDDIHPSWSPDGRHLAFYVRSPHYDTKLAIVPLDQNRAPIVVAHQVSIPSAEGPHWTSPARLAYLGAGRGSGAEHAVHTIDITTGKHSSAPLALMLGY